MKIVKKIVNIYTKGKTLNWSQRVLIIKKYENIVQWTYTIDDLNREETVQTLCV